MIIRIIKCVELLKDDGRVAKHIGVPVSPPSLGVIERTKTNKKARVYIYTRAFGAPRGSAPMARYYDSQLRSSLHSLLARRAFGTPKGN